MVNTPPKHEIIFYGALAMALATSSLVAGPKLEPKKPFGLSDRADSKNGNKSSEEKTAELRRQADTLGAKDASSFQDRDPNATASIGEHFDSALDPRSNSK